jgi:MoxR-like ATPase
MNVSLLFRNRSALKEAPFVTGCEKHKHLARRNTTGQAELSAILGRALVAALSGAVEVIAADAAGQLRITSRSNSTGRSIPSFLLHGRALIPNGGPEVVTYYLGLLLLAEALGAPAEARDLLEAYRDLLDVWAAHPATPEKAKPQFLRTADELYYWARYRAAGPTPEADRLAPLDVQGAQGDEALTGFVECAGLAQTLTQPRKLNELLNRANNGAPARPPAEAVEAPESASVILSEFAGPQARLLYEALSHGENCLLAGPTATGKTFSVELAARALGWRVEQIEGKEGLLDLDFMGGYVPDETDPAKRVWKDGPVTRAMRLAQSGECVLLFVDEGNRIPRPQVNILLTLLNRRPAQWCWAQGLIDVPDDVGPLHAAEIPLRAEQVWCPAANLRVVVAGNFGKAYAVYELDPALRRRFPTVVEYNYPPFEDERTLVVKRSGLSPDVASPLVKLAAETRRRHAGGTLHAPLDTESLIHWAAKCARLGKKSLTVAEVMAQAELTWADLVCGREHTGQVKAGELAALGDYLVSLKMSAGTWKARPV